MFRRIVAPLVALLLVGSLALEAAAQNAYYGTRPGTSARYYSGEYQAQFPNVVPTFSLPVYGGGQYRSYYRGGYGRGGYGGYGGYYGGGYPVYQQPVIIYPPAVYYGF